MTENVNVNPEHVEANTDMLDQKRAKFQRIVFFILSFNAYSILFQKGMENINNSKPGYLKKKQTKPKNLSMESGLGARKLLPDYENMAFT